MNRYVNADAILKMNYDDVIEYLENTDGEDVDKMIPAHWIDNECGYYNCSNCGEADYNGDAYLYCPYCGAKMDEII